MSRSQKRYDMLPASLPPRGLSRAEAAAYVGVGTSKFDEMVADGRMPQPKVIDGRRVWDRLVLDAAFSALPDAAGKADQRTDDVWGQARV
jgi:excisionase family DNA binding protein